MSIDYETFIVIDNGTAEIRAGFTGDDDPKVKMPTVVGRPRYVRMNCRADKNQRFKSLHQILLKGSTPFGEEGPLWLHFLLGSVVLTSTLTIQVKLIMLDL